MGKSLRLILIIKLLSATINREIASRCRLIEMQSAIIWFRLLMTLQAAIMSPVATEAVWKVFSKYGAKITQLNYSAESAKINSLLADLVLPDVATSVSAVPN